MVHSNTNLQNYPRTKISQSVVLSTVSHQIKIKYPQLCDESLTHWHLINSPWFDYIPISSWSAFFSLILISVNPSSCTRFMAMLRKKRVYPTYKYILGSPQIHELPKSTSARHEGHAESISSLPLPVGTLALTNIMSTALALLVESCALLADEPEVEYLPRCEARRTIVKEPAVSRVAVEAIHLLF